MTHRALGWVFAVAAAIGWCWTSRRTRCRKAWRQPADGAWVLGGVPFFFSSTELVTGGTHGDLTPGDAADDYGHARHHGH